MSCLGLYLYAVSLQWRDTDEGTGTGAESKHSDLDRPSKQSLIVAPLLDGVGWPSQGPLVCFLLPHQEPQQDSSEELLAWELGHVTHWILPTYT